MSYVDFTMYVRMVQDKEAEQLKKENEYSYDPITGEQYISADQDLSKYGKNVMNAGNMFNQQMNGMLE